MKPILREVAVVTSLLSLVLCAGCQGQKANADESPVVSNPAPVALEAPAAPKPVETAPPSSAPAQVTVVPPGSIIITNSNPKPAPATEANALATAVPGSTNVIEAVVPPAELDLSPALSDVVKLVQAGVGEDVLAAYITNSTEVFNIGSSEILYLHDLGVPGNLITALIQQDSTPQAQAAKKAAAAVKPLPPGVALTTPATNVYPPSTAQAAAVPATEAAPPTQPAPGAPAPAVVYTVPAAQEPVTVNHFYTELAPYGTWIEVPGYGRCWRPTVAVWNSSWRPYSDGGRWLWTDSGWYWYSDYSWGWAPFHYGRWTTHAGIGWVWAPDTHWGPAWVSWRRSSSYCGWAPLPPSAHWVAGRGFYHNTLSVGVSFEFGLSDHHYVYLPYNRFCDRRPSHYYVAPHHARAIHRETTVVNNYVTVNNNVVNNGVGFDRVAAVNRGTIRQVSLRPTSDVPRGTLRRELLDSEGKTLTVARPVTTASTSGITSPARPVSSFSNLRPQSGRGSSPVSNIGAPSNPRDGGAVQSGSSKSGSARGAAPIVIRGGVRPNADSQTTTTTPAPATGVTAPQSGGGRTVPAPPTTRSVEAPRGGRPTVTQGSETGSRSAVVMRPASSGPTTVVRVPAPVARQEAPRISSGPAQPSRAPVFNNPPTAVHRSAPSAPTYNPSPRVPVTPSPAPRAESSRAPSPPPSVQRSVPAPPSPSPSRSGGDGGSRSSRSSGDDNNRRNSR